MTTIYYSWIPGENFKAFPKGFRMIGGMDPNLSNAMAECVDSSACQRGAACTSSNNFFPVSACWELEVSMQFPICWDGVTLDSADQSHVMYNNGDLDGSCPGSHPVKLPQIEFFFRFFNYPGGQHEFSDGTGIFHADYVAGWDEDVLTSVLNSGCEFEEFEATAPICTAAPFTYRNNFRYQFGGGDTEFAAMLQQNRVPMADTSCISTEATSNIKELPRGTCLPSGSLISANGLCSDQTASPVASPVAPTPPNPPTPVTTPAPVLPPPPPPSSPPSDDPSDDDGGGGGACFSPYSIVEVESRGPTYMKDVRIGDILKTSDGYSKVYSFGHKKPSAVTTYLQIHTTTNSMPLEITDEHLLYIYSHEKIMLQPARAVQVGDRLWSGPGSGATVLAIKVVQRMGLYAPHTISGNLLVNGVVASNYMALPDAFTSIVSFGAQHRLQYAIFSPYRMVCGTLGCEHERYDTETGFPPFVAALVFVMKGAEHVALWFQSFQEVSLWGTVAFGYTLYCVWKKPVVKQSRIQQHVKGV